MAHYMVIICLKEKPFRGLPGTDLTNLQPYNLNRGLTYSIEGMTGYGEGIFIKKHSKDFYINIQRILI